MILLDFLVVTISQSEQKCFHLLYSSSLIVAISNIAVTYLLSISA